MKIIIEHLRRMMHANEDDDDSKGNDGIAVANGMSNIQLNWFWVRKWWLTETKRLILLINLPKIHTHYRYIFGCNAATEWTRCHRFGCVVRIICLLSIDRPFQWNHISQTAVAPATAATTTKGAHTNTFHHAKLLYHWMDRYEFGCPTQPQSVFRHCSTIIIIYLRVWMCFDTTFLRLFVRAFVWGCVRCCTRLYVYYIDFVWTFVPASEWVRVCACVFVNIHRR